MTSTTKLYDRLVRGVNLDDDSTDAAIRITADYEPIGGWEGKLNPPTYPTDREHPVPYLIEKRFHAGEVEDIVLLDSRQSQANRSEEALQAAIDGGRFFLPHLALEVESFGRAHRITSLTAPHRSRDAYFRDAVTPAGTAFDKTEVGAALATVSTGDATAMLRHSPVDLTLGVWDSHRELRLATKFPRSYTSEIVGHGVAQGHRAAGRADLIVSGAARVKVGEGKTWSLAEDKDTKGTKKLSELGHGSIPPSFTATGGVSVQRVSRVATIGFAGIARLGFASLDSAGARAARAVIACIALAGDRLAFARPGLFLRSGCELALTSESLSWVGTEQESFVLDRGVAVDLLVHAIERLSAAGVGWDGEPVRLIPGAELQKAIDRAFFSQPADEE